MVDFAQMEQANLLFQQIQQIERAIQAFDAGGVISGFTVTEPPFEFNSPAVMVSAAGVPYPPQMTDGVKEALHAKLDQLGQELAALGVTGVEAR
jgi:hypothetical protein